MRNDRGIRLELPYFLGAPNDWRGCYIPFHQSQVGMFQIGYKLEHGWKERAKDFFTQMTPRSLEGVDISTTKLLHYFEPAHRNTLQSYLESETPDSVHLLSRCKKGCVNLNAIVTGLNAELEGEGREASDLMATVREIQQVSPNHYSSIDDALKQVAPQVCKDIARHTKGKQPSYVYVVVGSERVDLEATVKTQVSGRIQGSVVGDGGGAGIGRQTEHVSISKDGVALMLLLKYKTKSLLEEHAKGLRVPSEGPSGSESAGSNKSGGTFTGSSAGTPMDYVLSEDSTQDSAGASLGLNDVGVLWTIGERVPLDEDDIVKNGLRAPSDASAIDATLIETEREISQKDSSSEASTEDDDPVSWTIGDRVALDEEHSVSESAMTMTTGEKSAAKSTNTILPPYTATTLSRPPESDDPGHPPVAQRPPASLSSHPQHRNAQDRELSIKQAPTVDGVSKTERDQEMSFDLPPKVDEKPRASVKPAKMAATRFSSSSGDTPFIGGGDPFVGSGDLPRSTESNVTIIPITPTEEDVLCGRNHQRRHGNMRFSALIQSHVSEYTLADKKGKMEITKRIVDRMKTVYRSRFLKQRGDGWEELPAKKACGKISSAFRYAAKRALAEAPKDD